MSRTQERTLHRRIILGAVVPPLVIFGVALVIGVLEIGRLTEEATRSRNLRVAETAASRIADSLGLVERAARRAALALRANQSEEDDKLAMALDAAEVPFGIVSVAVAMRVSESDHPEAAWMKVSVSEELLARALNERELTYVGRWLEEQGGLTEPRWVDRGGGYAGAYFVPVRTQGGFKGAIAFRVRLEALMAEVPRADEAVMTVISPYGPLTEENADSTREAKRPDAETLSRLAVNAADGQGVVGEWFEDGGQKWLVLPLGREGWTLVARLNDAAWLVPVVKTSGKGLLLLVLMIGGTVVLIRMGTERLARPILALRDAAVEVAAGARDVSIPRLGEGELGSLAEAFRVMTRQLVEHEEQLRTERQNQFGNLLGGLSNRFFFYRVNTSGELDYAGPTLAGVLGYESADALGRSLPVVDQKSAEARDRNRFHVLSGASSRCLYQVSVIHQDGSPRVLECFELPVVGEDGLITGLEGMAQDITDRLGDTERVVGILEVIPEAMIVYNQSGDIIGLNKEAEAVLIETGSLGPNAPVSLVVPEEHLFQDGLVVSYSLEGVDGQPRIFDISQRRLEMETGVVYIVALRDVTSHREALRRVRESEEMLSSIVHNSSTAIYLKDTDGRFVLINQSAADIIGHPVSEIVGRTDYELYPAEFADPIVRNDRRVMATNQTVTTEEIFEVDGEIAAFASVKFPVRDADGNVSGVGGISTDVTELRRQREALAEKSRQLKEEHLVLRGVLDAIPDPVFFKKKDGHYRYVNKSYAKFLGRQVSEVEGLADKDLYPEETQNLRRDQEAAAIAAGRRTKARIRSVSSDGSVALFEAVRAPVAGPDSEIIGIAGFDRNVTEAEVAREAAEAASRTKSNFLANMSHEIRTPMNSILGFAEILMGRVENADHKRLLDAIRSSGKTLLTLINDILDLSKVEAGKLAISKAPVDLPDLLSDMRRMFDEQARVKGITLSIEAAPDLPTFIIFDEVRLRQILQNLLSNAVKFTQSGGVSVHVSAERPAELSSHIGLSFAVTDTGIGIDPDGLKRVFEAFEQQPRQEQKTYGGTGLGLAISRRLVKLMDGELTVQSTVGAGSTFIARFSNVEVPAVVPETGNESAEVGLQDVKFDRATVLVVDDLEVNRLLLREYLEPLGLRVVEAENGKEGAEMAASIQPDIILMDMRMPVLGGFEATRLIKEHPVTATIPVIALTASAMADDEAAARKVCDGYLRKPIQGADLVSELCNFLSHTVLEGDKSAAAVADDPIHDSYAGTDEGVPESVTDRDALREELEGLRAEWGGLSDTASVDRLEEFGVLVAGLGLAYRWPALADWGHHTEQLAYAFELDLLSEHLNQLDRFYDALEQVPGPTIEET